MVLVSLHPNELQRDYYERAHPQASFHWDPLCCGELQPLSEWIYGKNGGIFFKFNFGLSCPREGFSQPVSLSLSLTSPSSSSWICFIPLNKKRRGQIKFQYSAGCAASAGSLGLCDTEAAATRAAFTAQQQELSLIYLLPFLESRNSYFTTPPHPRLSLSVPSPLLPA